MESGVAHGAEQEPAEASPAVAAHHEDLGAGRLVEQQLTGVAEHGPLRDVDRGVPLAPGARSSDSRACSSFSSRSHVRDDGTST